MPWIEHWKGDGQIEVATSFGGVKATVNPYDNLLRASSPWPPPEVAQKLCASNRAPAYRGTDRDAVESVLGYYSDLQSLRSEDAITWSVFGSLCYCEKRDQLCFSNALLRLLEINEILRDPLNIWLWRQITHPEKPAARSRPEIDFGIQTENLLLLGEAKWMSDVARYQGVGRNKTQLDLRQEYLEMYGNKVYGVRHLVVLAVVLNPGLLRRSEQEVRRGTTLHLREITWDQVCALREHPHSAELVKYLDWKTRHSGAATLAP
jgi:hypothetical protein